MGSGRIRVSCNTFVHLFMSHKPIPTLFDEQSSQEVGMYRKSGSYTLGLVGG